MADERDASPGADILVGFRNRTPSCQWYSNRGPALMTGHSCGVQNSVMQPYCGAAARQISIAPRQKISFSGSVLTSMLSWLKKSTATDEDVKSALASSEYPDVTHC